MGKGLMTPCIAVVLFIIFFNTNLSCGSCGNSSSSSSSSEHIEYGGGGDQGEAAAGGQKVGECLISVEAGESTEEVVEMEMGEERSNRRAMWATAAAGKRYISYEALRGDIVPCNRPGIPYYNCHALPKANPYSRGCSVITGCARGD